ncbi:hypothetical protein I203_104349 [Kwoniella mangroviensis CBS 8507]|uniref:uncharacterized protein n=1 Tax=Kwoniella mangroviensis CBS 8507 TaxID=1296122 RepID=UPI00080D128B|nr:uncharacterized protein I203_00704 [Kwoniella mangroviensis CBS 8507]OCF70569.1 hypothetical protein I203_00704 [Kwoniella mangroviensis CBS 8507]
MSHLQNLEDKISHTFTSGQPGTTGREPFEDDRGEGNPFHREQSHGNHRLKGASGTGHHDIGTGSDMIGQSSTGTGNERDINSGEGLRSHEQNPSRVGESGSGTGTGTGLSGTESHTGTDSGLTGTGSHTGTGSGLTGTGSHHHSGAGAGAAGAAGAGIAGAEYEANKHSGSHGSHPTGTGTGTGSGLTGTSGVGTHENRGVDYPTSGSGLGSGGTAGGAGITAGTHALGQGQGQGHHHGTGSDLTTHQHESGLTGSHAGTTGAAGTLENAARRETGSHTGGATDRVGNVGQDSALYERTGAGGPVTSGAAGTDRFDSDRHHGSGVTGSNVPTGSEGTGEHGDENLSRTSGAGGVLGTSDKDFVGRDRKAGAGGVLGAYADETGPFKGNTSGPGGNTALTGREGTNPSEDNPVARAKSAGQEIGSKPEGTSSHPGVAHGVTNQLEGKEGQEGTSVAQEHGEKKGLLQKIKEAI